MMLGYTLYVVLCSFIWGSDSAANEATVYPPVDTLYRAIYIADVEAIKNVLRNDAAGFETRARARDAAGRTALMTCGLDPQTDDRQNLDLACTAISRMFIETGANVNAVDNEGLSALAFAASKNFPEQVRLLVANGAAIEATDDSGRTALIKAAAHGNWKTVETLLQLGADANARDASGWSALHWTIRNIGGGDAWLRTLDALLNTGGIDINVLDNEGKSPLIYAASQGDDKGVTLLLDRGAKTGIVDNSGLTALQWVPEGAESLRELLASHAAQKIEDAHEKWLRDKAAREGWDISEDDDEEEYITEL